MIILMITCLIISNLKAESDSLNCLLDSNNCAEIIESNVTEEENVVSLEITQNKVVKKLENKKVNKEKKLTKPANWFSDAWDWVSSPFRPVWGKYNEGGTTNRNIPLLTSDRKNQDINKYLLNQ